MPNVVVINPFEIRAGSEARAEAAWDRLAAYFREQPGYVSARLHRAINPGARFHLVTVAEWETPLDFMAALENPEIQKLVEESPELSVNFPGLYEVIRT